MRIIKYTTNLKGRSPLILPTSDIAIVGSSGALARNPKGLQIDSHEYVVRFNRAPIKSYENLIGTKENLRVLNNHVFNNNKEDPIKWTQQPHDFVKNLRDKTLLYFASDIAPLLNYQTNTHESCIIYSVIYENLESVKKELNLELDSMFSIGMGFICLCVTSGIIPNIYGFDSEQDTQRDHYWETRPPAGPCHNISQEKEILKELQQRNLIRIF